jgi:lipoprotein-anchoring transpeptidase ErfK/SrfK
VIEPQAPEKIAFHSNFSPNTIIIDSGDRTLYFVLSPTEAYRYPISVGREGFTWTGTEVISSKQEWPDWHPPKEMIARDARLPDKMTGGIRNPLGALALYLGKTLYRIHGTNDESTIGQAASSGCFRMLNEHVVHLANLADIGTPVTVVKRLPEALTMTSPPASESDAAGRL